jgi:hypothetical protein
MIKVEAKAKGRPPLNPNLTLNIKGTHDYINQGCQMVYFQAKNPYLGKFWRALDWKMSIYFMAI